MVAKFLDDNKPKTYKANSHCFKLRRSYSISFNLSNDGEIFWGIRSRFLSCLELNPKGPYLSLEKEKENFCVVLAYFVKAGA